MKSIVIFGLFMALAYLSGSVPYGKLIGLRRGIDLQQHGSGNIGFANAWRVLGWKPAFVVLVTDALKGYLPLVLATAAGASLHQQMAVGVAAILGHCYPVWLKFRGGKGIATGLGITVAIEPRLAIVGLTAYLLIFLLTRRSAIASIGGTWFLVAVCAGFFGQLTWYYAALALFATWTHRKNIHAFVQWAGEYVQ